jgi:hypothetical protein
LIREKAMKLRSLGKDSTPTNSPTLYATDQNSYVVQGWIVTDAVTLARLNVPDDESIVEVPAALLDHLALDGLDGAVTNLMPPIVDVTTRGNYIIQGKQVTDAAALSQMSIPDHETCVQVMKSAVVPLLVGGRSWSRSRRKSETSSSRRFGVKPRIWRCATFTPRTSRKTDFRPGFAARPWTPRRKPSGGDLGLS